MKEISNKPKIWLHFQKYCLLTWTILNFAGSHFILFLTLKMATQYLRCQVKIKEDSFVSHAETSVPLSFFPKDLLDTALFGRKKFLG